MIVELCLCDLCYEDGEMVKAVAVYVDIEKEKHDVCDKHLELVKQNNLLFKMLPTTGDILDVMMARDEIDDS